jgi:methionine synthase I (cobalamin-dependent)
MNDLLYPFPDGPVVCGGAVATELQRWGLAAGAVADGWNTVKPDPVREVTKAYVEAGSRIVLANTFRSNRIALASAGMVDEVGRLNRVGVVIARRAANESARVFASMGPTGLPAAEVEDHAVLNAYREQAEAVAEALADGIVVETMTALPEAVLAVRAARETGLPVIASLVAGIGTEPGRLTTGETIEAAAEVLEAEGATAIGLNCMTAGEMQPLCERLAEATRLPLWMRPNAGLPELVEGRPVYWLTPEEFAAQALALVDAGARFIGGCCGVGPAHVGMLNRALMLRDGLRGGS